MIRIKLTILIPKPDRHATNFLIPDLPPSIQPVHVVPELALVERHSWRRDLAAAVDKAFFSVKNVLVVPRQRIDRKALTGMMEPELHKIVDCTVAQLASPHELPLGESISASRRIHAKRGAVS